MNTQVSFGKSNFFEHVKLQRWRHPLNLGDLQVDLTDISVK